MAAIARAGRAASRRRGPIDPVEHPLIDAAATAVVTVAPALGLGWAAWEAWGGLLTWQDLVVFAITYLLAGIGITVGFHRLLTHRSFRTSAASGECWQPWDPPPSRDRSSSGCLSTGCITRTQTVRGTRTARTSATPVDGEER